MPAQQPHPRPTLARLAALAAPLALALPLAACGTATSSGTAAAAGARTVRVALTDDGCPAGVDSTTAGPTTFKIENTSASKVSEFELLRGEKIVGEKENLTPGLSGSFSLDLAAGSYTAYCPGATTERTTFTVTGAAAATPSADPALQQAVTTYAAYVEEQVDQLVPATTAFAAAVEAGDVARAKALYGPARVFYERVEPVAESFGDLDPSIDARIADVDDAASWTGFHRLEKALWVDGSTAGTAPVAKQLVADVTKLQSLVATTTYQPAEVANGASGLLDEVASSKVTGEEENYSHLDLLDFSANIDGSKAAYQALRPALVDRDPDLATTLDARFAAVQRSLSAYGSGSSFVPYPTLTKAQVRTLAQQVDALAEPLSTVAASVVTGSAAGSGGAG